MADEEPGQQKRLALALSYERAAFAGCQDGAESGEYLQGVTG